MAPDFLEKMSKPSTPAKNHEESSNPTAMAEPTRVNSSSWHDFQTKATGVTESNHEGVPTLSEADYTEGNKQEATSDELPKGLTSFVINDHHENASQGLGSNLADVSKYLNKLIGETNPVAHEPASDEKPLIGPQRKGTYVESQLLKLRESPLVANPSTSPKEVVNDWIKTSKPAYKSHQNAGNVSNSSSAALKSNGSIQIAPDISETESALFKPMMKDLATHLRLDSAEFVPGKKVSRDAVSFHDVVSDPNTGPVRPAATNPPTPTQIVAKFAKVGKAEDSSGALYPHVYRLTYEHWPRSDRELREFSNSVNKLYNVVLKMDPMEAELEAATKLREMIEDFGSPYPVTDGHAAPPSTPAANAKVVTESPLSGRGRVLPAAKEATEVNVAMPKATDAAIPKFSLDKLLKPVETKPAMTSAAAAVPIASIATSMPVEPNTIQSTPLKVVTNTKSGSTSATAPTSRNDTPMKPIEQPGASWNAAANIPRVPKAKPVRPPTPDIANETW